MIIDVDHMSIKSLDATLDLAATESYPGIVASHVLMFDLTEKPARHERMRTRAQLERIARLGGMIGVMTQAPEPETGIVQPGETDPGPKRRGQRLQAVVEGLGAGLSLCRRRDDGRRGGARRRFRDRLQRHLPSAGPALWSRGRFDSAAPRTTPRGCSTRSPCPASAASGRSAPAAGSSTSTSRAWPTSACCRTSSKTPGRSG